MLSRCFTSLAPLLMLAAVHAQNPGSRDRVADIRIHSDLVLINTLVTDRHGRAITGLGASSFRLFEDGQEQVVKYCVGEDMPASVGLVLDTSGSMGDKIDLLKQAAVQFVRAANPADEYLLLEFQARPQVVIPFTADTDDLLHAIASVEPGGATALFDAVHLAVSEMRHAKNPRRALVIISDGMDNHSRYHDRETRRLVSEVDFPIYGINVWQPQYGNRYAIQRRDPATLESISIPTGGRTFAVRDLKKLPAVTELISLEIRNEYVLGFTPSSRLADGRFHQVRVHVDSPDEHGLKISSRTGYRSPK